MPISVILESLMPCPFCGGAADVERQGNPRQSCIVSCTNCGGRIESNENGAGFAWNSRAAESKGEVDPRPGE